MDQPEPVLYTEAIEGFFGGPVGKRLSPEARERLKEAGLDLDAKFAPMYPREQFRELMEIVRQDLYPRLPRAQGYREIGGAAVSGYGETMIGRALLSVARMLGPMRLLGRMDVNVRGVNNFTQTRLEKLGDKEVKYWFNELSVNKDYTHGLIVAALEACGGKEIQVDYLTSEEPHTFHMRWS